LLTFAIGCGGSPEELESSESLASESQALKRSAGALPPGLSPSLVKDIQVGDIPNHNAFEQSTGSPPHPVSTGSVVYFRAATASTGMELWRTDGTPEGTRLVRDIIPGPDHSSISEMVVARDTVFLVQHHNFLGPDISNTLWKSDGTAEGTVPLRTAQGTTLTANELIACNGQVFFHGMGSQRSQLWRTDGTPEGTVLLTTALSFNQRSLSESSRSTCVGDTLFFLGATGYDSYELWKSDGTPAGTVKLSAVGPVWSSWTGSSPQMVAVGSRVFLNTNYYYQPLWTSDGTPEGTRNLPNVGWQAGTPSPDLMAAVNGKLFFATFNWSMGTGLWTSDGTPEGTRKYLNVMNGPPPASPISLTVVGDTVLFTNNLRLYKSDGTAEGTVPLKNLNLGTPQLGVPLGLALPDGRMLFTATSSGAWRTWVSDGTEAGTTELRTAQGQLLKWPSRYTRLGDRVLLWANEGVHGTEPWVTDGTPEGTHLVADLYRVNASDPRDLTDVEGTLFFTAHDAAHHRELWKTDGTAEGTALVKELGPNTWNQPKQLTRVGSSLFFFTEVSSLELWKSDGTEAGTVRVHDFGTLVGASWTRTAAVGSSLFFSVYQFSTGIELWKSDGTPEGTVLVKDLVPGALGSGPEKLTAAGNLLFFIAHDYATGYELWRSDGTAEGSFLLKDIRPGGLSSMDTYAFREMRAVGNTLYFTADDGVHGTELWKTDGTPEGTVRVKDLRPGTTGSNPYDLAEVDGVLYFTAEDGVHGRELWRTDGTPEGTVLVRDLVPGTGSPFPATYSYQPRSSLLHGIGGSLYFVANDGVHGREPWKSDGTAVGTVLLRDVMPGPLGSGVELTGFVPVGPHGAFAFSAITPAKGLELWTSDGTPEGTRLVADVAEGARSSSPLLLTVSGPRLFFVADEGVHGRELWSVKHTAFKSR
jgi:ELWxxDGT repeat protein